MDIKRPSGKQLPHNKPLHLLPRWLRLQNNLLTFEDQKEYSALRRLAYEALILSNLYLYLTKTKQVKVIRRLYLKRPKRRFSRKLLNRISYKPAKKLVKLTHTKAYASQVYKQQLQFLKPDSSFQHRFFKPAANSEVFSSQRKCTQTNL